MGLGFWEFFQGPLMRCQAQLPISFGGIGLLSIRDCAPFAFLRRWALVLVYLCSKFHIFDKPILEEYVYQVERGPHMFQSCLRVAQDGFPPATREKHLLKKSLAVISIASLHAFLMDIHHDTSLRFILKDDSIFSASKVHIHSYLNKGARPWLVVRPFIHSFCITHSIFISTLCFISVWFNLWHLVFSCVSVDVGWTHLAPI
jgi:hypothetical protein